MWIHFIMLQDGPGSEYSQQPKYCGERAIKAENRLKEMSLENKICSTGANDKVPTNYSVSLCFVGRDMFLYIQQLLRREEPLSCLSSFLQQQQHMPQSCTNLLYYCRALYQNRKTTLQVLSLSFVWNGSQLRLQTTTCCFPLVAKKNQFHK